MPKHSGDRIRTGSVSAAPPHGAADARQTLAQIDELLAVLSHELRQPLAAALAAIEIQKQSPLADRQEKARRVVEQQIQYMAAIVGDLTEVSRISRGAIDLHREHLDICALLREAVAMTESLFAERKHHVATVLSPVPLWINGDRVRVKQVFANLLKNAASYTPAGGAVRVHADLADGHVRVRVRDNGVGISADSLERIFELFHRGQHSTDRQSASIGLAVVRHLVELHGGTVTAASDGPGRGSEFTVTFPHAGDRRFRRT